MKIQAAILLLFWSTSAAAFHITQQPQRAATATPSTVTLYAKKKQPKKPYEPKWKKKKTLAEQEGPKDFDEVGLKGNIQVVFQMGNETKSTMALPGQPLRDVATQAGQFIKYGCGKGECGTCEAMVDGKWIRPCMATVPPTTEVYTVRVKEVKNKAKSSGKFYSARSFVMGFWNNLLGMKGFIQSRRAARKNWNERQEYEDMIKQLTLEKKQKKRSEQQKQKQS